MIFEFTLLSIKSVLNLSTLHYYWSWGQRKEWEYKSKFFGITIDFDSSWLESLAFTSIYTEEVTQRCFSSMLFYEFLPRLQGNIHAKGCLQLYLNYTSAWIFFSTYTTCLQQNALFSENKSGELLLYIVRNKKLFENHFNILNTFSNSSASFAWLT